MRGPHYFKATPSTGKVNIDPSGGNTDQSGDPMVLNGKLFLAAERYMSGIPLEGDKVGFVQLVLSRGQAGLYLGLSPDAAREVAAQLVRSAEQAEAALANVASAMMKDSGL